MLRCAQHTDSTAWWTLISQWSPRHSSPFIKNWRPRASMVSTVWMHAWLPWFQLSRSRWVQCTSRPTGKVALSSVSSSSAWMHLTAPPRKGKRWRQVHFLSESTINCRQHPGSTSCSSPGTASQTFPTWRSPLQQGVHTSVRTALDDLCQV